MAADHAQPGSGTLLWHPAGRIVAGLIFGGCLALLSVLGFGRSWASAIVGGVIAGAMTALFVPNLGTAMGLRRTDRGDSADGDLGPEG